MKKKIIFMKALINIIEQNYIGQIFRMRIGEFLMNFGATLLRVNLYVHIVFLVNLKSACENY